MSKQVFLCQIFVRFSLLVIMMKELLFLAAFIEVDRGETIKHSFKCHTYNILCMVYNANTSVKRV